MTRRRSLTRAQRVKIWDAHDGICHICELPIILGQPWQADHIIPRGLTGSDELEEYAPAHVDCHQDKTRNDNRTVKKATRVRANHLGIRKPSRMQGSRDSRLKKKVSGEVVDRETGEPIGGRK